MGDIAEDIIYGRTCTWCGVMFIDEHGYPVVCRSCWKNSTPQEHADVQQALYPQR